MVKLAISHELKKFGTTNDLKYAKSLILLVGEFNECSIDTARRSILEFDMYWILDFLEMLVIGISPYLVFHKMHSTFRKIIFIFNATSISSIYFFLELFRIVVVRWRTI